MEDRSPPPQPPPQGFHTPTLKSLITENNLPFNYIGIFLAISEN
jgi:hypothetical protein